MIIIYYRDKDDNIVDAHGNAGNNTLEELEEMVRQYNSDSKKRRIRKAAYVADVRDDSLTAYLFRKAEDRKAYNRERLRDAIDSIEAALSAVQELEN